MYVGPMLDIIGPSEYSIPLSGVKATNRRDRLRNDIPRRDVEVDSITRIMEEEPFKWFDSFC